MAANLAGQFIRACSSGKAEVVQNLLAGGLSPETTDKYGLTGLIWAARKGQVRVAKDLVDAGADLETKDRRGRTAVFHAVVFNRHAFVEYLALQGAFLSPIDIHGCTPLDLAHTVENVRKSELDRMVEILTRLGAKRKSSKVPLELEEGQKNSFHSSGIYGGPELPIQVDRIHIQLNRILSKWRVHYTNAVKQFYLTKFVDGSLIRHTEQMQLIGAGKPHRGAGAMHIKIGIPEEWWSQDELSYKMLLTGAMEEGLHSSIALLQRNKHAVDGEILLTDWANVRREFLETPAPPYAAESQRATLKAALEVAKQAVEARKTMVVAKGEAVSTS